MKIFQNRCLNIIGIKADDAKNKYNIVAIEEHINTTCVKTLKKMLGNSEHPIAIKLTTTRRTMSTFKFSIAIPKTEAYKNSFIQQHIKTIRDEAMPRSKSEKTDMTPIRNQPDAIAIQKPKAKCPKCGKLFEAIYGVKVHLRACKINQQPDIESQLCNNNSPAEPKTVHNQLQCSYSKFNLTYYNIKLIYYYFVYPCNLKYYISCLVATTTYSY